MILLPHLCEMLIIPKNGLFQKFHNRCEAFSHIGNRTVDLSYNLVNCGNGIQCLRCQISDFGSNNRKSPARFASPGCLNIGI